MKKWFAALAIAATAACSNNPMAPSAATLNSPATGAKATSSTFHTADRTKPGLTTNCDTPAFGNVVFDAQAFGKVTVHNVSRCANDFLFAIWDAGNYDDQTLVSWISQTIAPGATAELTLGIPNPTCTRYQRDVYFGLKKPNADNMHNYVVQWSADKDDIDVFYANGDPNFQPGGICEPTNTPVPPVVVPPPPPPPVDACPNIEGLQLSIPQGYVFVDGGCYPESIEVPNDPPSVVDPPPGQDNKIGFCHIEYNTHTEGRDHHVVTNFIHEQNLSITQQAITNGHSDPAHHSYDHLGACTGTLAPIITQGTQ